MSTHRVRQGASIAELLQALSAAPARSKSTAAAQQAVTSGDQPTVRDPAALQQELKKLAENVDLDSEPALRELRRPVIRRILLWEFGESFLQHPEFQGTLTSIESAMDADPAIPIRFQNLLKHLRRNRA